MQTLKFIILVFIIQLSIADNSFSQTTGPESGTLLIIGGNASDSLFIPIFKELAGGDQAEIVIIPTARDDESLAKDSGFHHLRARFAKYQFKKITILHTRSPEVANSSEFSDPLTSATGIWIQGGRQWRLADSYLNTRTHLEIFGVLHRKGVVAGTSAGATIQGSYLVRGDTQTNTIMMGDHETGLALIKNIAIDQHLLARNRHFDMFEVLEAKPDLLGIGLDENTAIIVNQNTFKVIGQHYIVVYDNTRWSAEKDTIFKLSPDQHEFYFLKPGEQYDMLNRTVIQ
ncbi:MAG: cyanophycinase [Bacteroidales bacterium]|jgi:cyanophycinase|nr:cyanophycinase [Bacteroidales bacterium]